jgi:hypothetical protein
MGYSDNRAKELEARLQQMSPPPSAEETAKIRDAMNTYLRDREDRLSTLLALIGDTGDKRLGDVVNCFSQWLDSLKRFGDGLNSTSDISTSALIFVTRASFEEKQAIESLRATNVGAAHDVLIYRAKVLEEKIKALADKWGKLNGETGYFDATEKASVDAIRRLVDDVIRKTGPAADQLARVPNDLYNAVKSELKLLNESVSRLGKSAGLDGAARKVWEEGVKVIDPAGKLRSALTKEALKAAGVALPSTDDPNPSRELGESIRATSQFIDVLLQQRVNEYREAIQKRTSGLLVLFNETYNDTKKFVEENGFDKAKVRYQETSDTLDRWASELPSDGLKSDFGDYRKALLDRLSRHLSEIETMYNRFVRENQGRFLGPLGPDISEALTQTKKWEEYRVGLVSMGLDEKVRKWREDLRGILVVSMRDAIEKSAAELDYFDPEVRQQLQTPFEAFRDEVTKEAAALVAQVDQIYEKEQRVWSSDLVASYLDRRILRDALPQ